MKRADALRLRVRQRGLEVRDGTAAADRACQQPQMRDIVCAIEPSAARSPQRPRQKACAKGTGGQDEERGGNANQPQDAEDRGARQVPDQEVGKLIARTVAVEEELSGEPVRLDVVHAVPADLAAELKSVLADDL